MNQSFATPELFTQTLDLNSVVGRYYPKTQWLADYVNITMHRNLSNLSGKVQKNNLHFSKNDSSCATFVSLDVVDAINLF